MHTTSRLVLKTALLLASTCVALRSASAGELALRSQEFATDLAVGYAVNIVDVDGDKKLDIVVVDTTRVVWYQNPSWKPHILIQDQTKKDNVCLGPYDIDGDGKPEFALGADWNPSNTKSGGTIQWLTRPTSGTDDRWIVRSISEEPTTHRLRWADLDGDGRSELIVVPLMGRDSTKPNFQESGVRILAFSVPKNPEADRWPMRVLNDEMHVCHNFQPLDFDGDKDLDILVTSFEGVNLLTNDGQGKFTRTLIGAGNQATSPNRGASEIKAGRLADGSRYIATIEPWHGHQVVVYTEPADPKTGLWQRTVVDEELKWGHAVWCANLDADADEELIIGVRDDLDEKDPKKRRGLRIYDPSAKAADAKAAPSSSIAWTRSLIEPGTTAIEDLAVADLDGDGKQEIIVVGRQTHNGRIYWNETK
ncbi:MAG: VCBS repeat-containing protein [Planctomycetia bacterium]|nr:VCBS repeat-containing protein [Planctomycetia bacterium]